MMKRPADPPATDGHWQDSLQEECAVFGIYGNNEAHLLTALGLHALQHRGQEATGMVSFDGEKFNGKLIDKRRYITSFFIKTNDR